MSKYDSLTAYLLTLEGKPWEATLSDVEKVLGFELPASAHSWYAWWSNPPRTQSRAWLNAGYRVVNVDLDKKQVTFKPAEYVPAQSNGEADVSPLSIAEAKIGLARAYDVKPDQIEIVIRG